MSEEFEDFEDFEEFELEEGDEEFNEEFEEDFEEDFDREMLASLIDTAAATALKLTELVVDNNHRNNIKMDDADIYRIHTESFSSAFASIVQGQQ